MKKVFCIYPPSPRMNRTARCQQPVKELIVLPPLPPSDLMYCAAVARDAGAVCKIKDYSVEGGNLADLQQDIKIFKPDIILINIASTTFNNDMKAVYAVKEVFEDILVVVTGAHFLTFNTSVIEQFPELDVIIRGEPEFTFKEIVSGKNFSEIDGITYRKKEGLIVSNPDRKFIDSLDDLPFPARDLVRNDLYIRPDTGEKQAIIRVAAGCPYHCFFCLATPVSGSKPRYRSADNIIAEIKECIQKYGINNFVFWSDLFTADLTFVKDLCKKIIAETPGIIWSANSRVDCINEEILDIMKKSGCSLISFGIESGSQEILDKIGKKITKSQAENAVTLCKKFNIKVFTYFVLGLPWEDERHIYETINFAVHLDADYTNFYTAAVLPGTRFYDYIKENQLGDIEDEGFYCSPYYYPCVKTHFLSKKKIYELHKFALRKFYLRPSYIFKKLCEINSLNQFINYFKAGFSVLLKK